MKRLLQKTVALAWLSVLMACAREVLPEKPGGTSLPFRLDVSVPGIVQTKSLVGGREGIWSMQLICFDENGLYVGLGAAAFSPSEEGGGSGSLVGSVPGNTTAIHFVANAGLIPDERWKWMSELELIGSLQADESHTHIVYWGCHKEADSATLAGWLNASPGNTILLLRDRAKITLEEPDPTWNHSAGASVAEYIVSARFAVCNGRCKGMTAPFDRSLLDFDYDAPLTLPSDPSRYRGDASQLVPHTEEQFLFEDENTLESSVKVILEITYMRGTPGNMASLIKYHQVMLMDDDYALYPIRRNRQYNLIVGNLPSSVAYDSFEAALAGSPSNNQTVVVKEIVPQVNSSGCSMTILGGTTHIVQKDAEGGPYMAHIDFSLMKNGAPDPQMSVSDFKAEWLSNKYVSYPDAPLSITEIVGRPGYYRLSVPLYQPITDDLKEGKILLTDTRYGLSRFIKLYSVTAFDFAASLEADSAPHEPYVLAFTIPDHYPPDLFPFKVRILTDALTPTPAQNEQKALGVEVRQTSAQYGVPWNYLYTYEVFGPGAYAVSFQSKDASQTSPGVILDADYFARFCNFAP